MQALQSACRMLGKCQQRSHHHKLIGNQKRFYSMREKKIAAVDFLRLMKAIPRGPVTTLRNTFINLYVTHVLSHEFDLEEFLDACPHAVQTVAQILSEAKDDKTRKEMLTDLMSEDCMQKVITNWDALEGPQQADVIDMDTSLCLFHNPQLNVIHEDDKCYLRARMKMLHFMDIQLWSEDHVDKKADPDQLDNFIQSDPLMKWTMESISANMVELERDVTEGNTEGSWQIIDMSNWPKPLRIM